MRRRFVFTHICFFEKGSVRHNRIAIDISLFAFLKDGKGKRKKRARNGFSSESESRGMDKQDFEDESDDEKVVLEGSDEEIDEEIAFNSDDEDMYGDVFATILRRKRGAASKGEDEEDEEGDEDEDEAGHAERGPGISLMSMLDDDDEEEEAGPVANEAQHANARKKMITFDLDDNDEADDTEEEEEDVSADKYAQLVSLVSQISGKNSKKSSSRTLRTEARAEGEYNTSATPVSGKLSLSTLVGTMKDSVSHSTLKKQLSHLDRAAEIQSAVPKVVRERAERKAAFDSAKEKVTEWQPLVKKNRESRRLVMGDRVARTNVTTKKLAVSFEPSNDFEKEIDSMLESSGIASAADVQKAEQAELRANKYTVEEVQERQKKLAQLRALMFYEEQKAKRVKKIKSKMYRKLKKRREHREEEKAKQRLREIDPEAARAMDEDAAVQRAKERMSLRHKNTSKYIKGLLKNGGIGRNSAAKEAIVEQLRRGEDLRRHQIGRDSDDEDEGQDIELQARNLVRGIEEDIEKSSAPTKGLFALKFYPKSTSNAAR